MTNTYLLIVYSLCIVLLCSTLIFQLFTYFSRYNRLRKALTNNLLRIGYQDKYIWIGLLNNLF